jgi:hypothetical protein
MTGIMYHGTYGFKYIFQLNKKQGATGITTVAPYITGQWGRGNNRLSG